MSFGAGERDLNPDSLGQPIYVALCDVLRGVHQIKLQFGRACMWPRVKAGFGATYAFNQSPLSCVWRLSPLRGTKREAGGRAPDGEPSRTPATKAHRQILDFQKKPV